MNKKTSEKPIIYKVHVEHQRVSIEAIPPNRPEYAKAQEHAIQRLREAMELKQRLAEDSDFSDETHYFSVLETAREFAEMIIKDIEDKLIDDYNSIENFKG